MRTAFASTMPSTHLVFVVGVGASAEGYWRSGRARTARRNACEGKSHELKLASRRVLSAHFASIADPFSTAIGDGGGGGRMCTVSGTPFAFLRRSVTLALHWPDAPFFGSTLGLSHFSFWHRSVSIDIGVL